MTREVLVAEDMSSQREWTGQWWCLTWQGEEIVPGSASVRLGFDYDTWLTVFPPNAMCPFTWYGGSAQLAALTFRQQEHAMWGEWEARAGKQEQIALAGQAKAHKPMNGHSY